MIQYDWASGTRFGRLKCTGKSYMKGKRRFVETICDCDTIKWVGWDGLKRGLILSCGCLHRDNNSNIKRSSTHGLSDHRLYYIYTSMMQRCYNEKNEAFYRYGAVGVRVYQEWVDDFMAFYNWAINNGYTEWLTLDRYPNKKGSYEPINCRWATEEQQARNRTTNREIEIFGEKKIMVEWLEDERCLVKRTQFCNRLKNGWSAELALTTPK